ncbi:antitoxin YezG family protein, partial [Bacillus cereus]|nr:antitoxin YezG family protein [Bacillus cereus]
LQEIFIKNNQEPWYSFDMIVTSEGKVKIYYGYTKWYQSTFGSNDRVDYFEYKYLGKKPSNENERRKFEEMKEYEEQNKS